MVNHLLKDKNIYPDDKVLARYLGKTKNTWDSFIEFIKVDYPLISIEWRYYNDGKSWLCKVTKKAKTICWISIWEEYFKVTFYFTSKANEEIKNSSVTDVIKKQWLDNEFIGKIKPVTIKVRKNTDLKIIKQLIEIKGNIK